MPEKYTTYFRSVIAFGKVHLVEDMNEMRRIATLLAMKYSADYKDGIPKEILKENLDRCVRIPMSDKVRSLNLSNCAALTIYEVLRQQDYPNLSKVEVQKGEEFLYDL